MGEIHTRIFCGGWDTIQLITCIGGSAESSLGAILPRLFFGKSKPLPSIVGTLVMMTVKKSGLGIQYLVTLADEKFLSSQFVSTELIRAVTLESLFSTTKRLQAVKGERSDGRKPEMTSRMPKYMKLLRNSKPLTGAYTYAPNRRVAG